MSAHRTFISLWYGAVTVAVTLLSPAAIAQLPMGPEDPSADRASSLALPASADIPTAIAPEDAAPEAAGPASDIGQRGEQAASEAAQFTGPVTGPGDSGATADSLAPPPPASSADNVGTGAGVAIDAGLGTGPDAGSGPGPERKLFVK